MYSNRLLEDKLLYGHMYGKYLLSGAQFYNSERMDEGISKAVVEGDLLKVKKFIEAGADVNVTDCYGNGPVHIAVVKDNSPILSYLLSVDNVRINQRNHLGETPLFKALMDEKFQIAEQLVCAGVDVKIADNTNTTPLHLAVANTRVAQILIQHNADINAVDKFQQTPLHCAVDFNYLESVYMLLYYNADVSIPDANNYTPFMLAMERRNVEIQKALFEYVVDYEDVTTTKCNYSTLGLAMICDSPLTEEMILRGADVNNVNEHTNGAFNLVLHYLRYRSNINLNVFRLVWERMDYELMESMSILGSLSLLQTDLFHGILDIFMNSDRLSIIAESVHTAQDFGLFVIKCIEHNLPFAKLTELLCLLLCHGYTPIENDLIIIFNYWGYCEMFRILLHMDIRRSPCFSCLDTIPTRLIHDVRFDVTALLNKLVNIIKKGKCSSPDILAVMVNRVLDYCVYPPLFDAYLNLKKTDCASLKMRALSKVPSLLELARNQTREHIKKSYQVKSSSELYTLINNLDIANYYKKILTFEVVIYLPTFSENNFKQYIEMLEKTEIRKQAREPLIQAAYQNSFVEY